MSLALARRMSALAWRVGWSKDDLLDETRATLAALADIECRYEALWERLETSLGANSRDKDRLRAEWDDNRKRERALLERRLGKLEKKVRWLRPDS